MSPLVFALRRARIRARLTQAELADAVGVRQATISDLETGKSRRIELDLLEKLAAKLNVHAPSLIAEHRSLARRRKSRRAK